MKDKIIFIKKEENLEDIVNYIFQFNWKYLYLNGDLGAGKTTLTKLIAKKLGIKENVVSPTFNKMKVYSNLIHIDAYNLLGDLEEFEDYFEDKKVIIEWSKNLNLDYENFIAIDIKFSNDERIYEITINTED
ncbi:tRNA (adenosine(37)-N6)-threonylcarbamoyltransferase complex ATPase subunit type 1 TsaE [Mycoplasma sp. 480]|uniref:tRNA (adenosine(37)-N6)-threonylcarbamoyltransferase complex ATPase subunit type 1 TsaE n=1 Tax=Mycoplasma sp. 480 TaxID=3440155 RepID=UPI003F51A030